MKKLRKKVHIVVQAVNAKKASFYKHLNSGRWNGFTFFKTEKTEQLFIW